MLWPFCPPPAPATSSAHEACQCRPMPSLLYFYLFLRVVARGQQGPIEVHSVAYTGQAWV